MTTKIDNISNYEIYTLLTNSRPCWIEGLDFNALNYGKQYSLIRSNNRKLAISANTISYLSITPESNFPQNIKFFAREPKMALTESTHIGDYNSCNIKLNLEQLIIIFKERKAIFK